MDVPSYPQDFEVLKALFDFTATVAQTLSFEKDDLFIFHFNNNIKKNWWHVINVNGKQGYIPSNYVSFVKVTKDEYSFFLNQSIEHLGKEIAKEGGGSDKQLELMQDLISKKQSIEKKVKSKCYNKEKLCSSKSLPNSTVVETQDISEKSKVHPPPLRLTASESKFSISSQVSSGDLNSEKIKISITPQAVYALVQQVREATDLSFELSRVAVGVVAEGLVEAAPCLQSVLDGLQGPSNTASAVLDQTQDARRLRAALAHLAACHDDAQQRSWQLWDDEPTIIDNINILTDILRNADTEISKMVVKSEGYQQVSVLLEYYQMEDRWNIRELLIEAFTLMSSLDRTIISILLNSVLPMELAREMEANLKNTIRVTKLAKLLTIIFSTGEPMPITHLEHVGSDFVKVVLSEIEGERDNELSDVMLTLLLAYNLQFRPHASTNITVRVLEETDSVKTFSEKILLLLNREEDPVQPLKGQANSFHSVLKLFMDLFTRKTAAKLFYTNDIKVLVDIITRQVTDLSPNEKRTEYLGLCKLVLTGCDGSAYEHRLGELRDRFSHILSEETPPVELDRKLVRQIMQALPHIFGY